MSDFYDNQKKEVDFMGDILSAFDDIEEGKPVKRRLPDGTDFVNDFESINLQETKNLLNSLNEVVEYGNLINENQQNNIPQYDSYDDDDFSSIYGHYIPSEDENFIPEPNLKPMKPAVENIVQQSRTTQFTKGNYWGIVEESVMGLKNAKIYSVKCNVTGHVILDNIMMYESALSLKNLLNEGKSLSDPKILGIISSGIQYTSVVKEGLAAAKERQKVLKESKYDKAQELDKVIAEYKNKANELKYKVLNFLQEEGFITK